MKNILIISISSFIFFACNSKADENAISISDTEQTGEPVIDTARGMNVVNEPDERFLKERTAAILIEVEISQLAVQKTNNQSLKKLSNQIIADRLEILEELKKLSSLKNVTLATNSGDQHASLLTDLQNLPAADFDKKYLSFIIELLEEDTRKFEKAANKANSPEIKIFASKSLPVMRTHLDAARSL